MFADFMRGCTEVPIGYPIRTNLEKEHYKINLHNPNTIREIEYEKFDYNIIKENINPFADTLVNEMWPFFRMLWKTRGGYDAEVLYNPEIDLREFGSQFGPGMFTAVYKFSITDDGKWTANFDMKFEQVNNPYDDRLPAPEGRKGPFYAQDYSRLQSNTVKRARKLARPDWSDEEGRSGQDFSDLLNEEAMLNATKDFSFALVWDGSGDWGDFSNYQINVSDVKRDLIPEKDVMHVPTSISIPLSSIKRKNTELPT